MHTGSRSVSWKCQLSPSEEAGASGTSWITLPRLYTWDSQILPEGGEKRGSNAIYHPCLSTAQESHPTSAAPLKGSRPCLQGRSRRGNWALLHLTISLDLMGCSPFKSNFEHSLPMFPRDVLFFTKLFRNGSKVWKILWALFWGSLVRNPHFQAGKTPVSKT